MKMMDSVVVDNRKVGRGDKVVIKATGAKGKVMFIGQHGLVSLYVPDQVMLRPFAPSELTIEGTEDA